ncbi:MAG: DNA topoisomerase VI subunit B [Planctomycetota bacterium]|jgi:DNA topoisomerase-6 subunit B
MAKSKRKKKKKAAKKPARKSTAKRKGKKSSKAKPKKRGAKKAAGKSTRKRKKKDILTPRLPFTEDKPGVPSPKGRSAKQIRAARKAAIEAESASAPEPKIPKSRRGGRVTADVLAKKQREISVSEFFRKNRHLLGFDNPTKALLTTIKEAVDNAIDACEDARIPPAIDVIVVPTAENRFRVSVTDNGPGIVKAQVPKIFGKLLYGSKFHSFKMSRGQQGIGISAAGMYGQMTTGKPTTIVSKTGRRKPANLFEVVVNAKKNTPDVLAEDTVEWDVPHGTRVEIELEGRYQKGSRSIDDYLKSTAIANPHCQITYKNPQGDVERYKRATEELPPEPREIKPHPYGVELGVLIEMLNVTKARNMFAFFRREFSRVSPKIAREILAKANISEKASPKRIARQQADALAKAIPLVKIMSPPTDCIIPIGEELILSGLKKEIDAEFYTAVTRKPSVYRGNPFQIEVGLAWGRTKEERKEAEKTEADKGIIGSKNGTRNGGGPLAKVLRFANRVPLQYQQSGCVITKTITRTDWRSYKVPQSRGALPSGPLVILVHMASVWVPFTSESKEAIASYPEIEKEVRLGLRECGRRLSVHLSRKRREAEVARKRSHIELYIPHIGIALKQILDLTDRQENKIISNLTDMLYHSHLDAKKVNAS